MGQRDGKTASTAAVLAAKKQPTPSKSTKTGRMRKEEGIQSYTDVSTKDALNFTAEQDGRRGHPSSENKLEREIGGGTLDSMEVIKHIHQIAKQMLTPKEAGVDTRKTN